MQQLMGPISLINPLTITPIAAYTPTAFNQQVPASLPLLLLLHATSPLAHPTPLTSLTHQHN